MDLRFAWLFFAWTVVAVIRDWSGLPESAIKAARLVLCLIALLAFVLPHLT